MNKKLIFSIGFAVVVVVVLVLLGGHGSPTSSSSPNTPSTTPSTPVSTGSSGTLQVFTAADVAQHATAQSCYTIINGHAYDITSYLPQHPGGEARLLPLCGTDGTTAFDMKHGSNQRAQTTLDAMIIGTLH